MNKKNYIISIIFIILGVGCFIAYYIIGSEIASDGRLIEPFGLIPIGYLFVFVGILIGLKSTINKKNKKQL